MNTIGKIFTFTGFGESHGVAIGGVIDGMPAGVKIDTERIQHELDRRRPGQSAITGTSIGFIIRNENQHSSDYDQLKNAFRPSHADYTYTTKYGIRDHRGGGRSSARETATRVVAGAFAKQALEQLGITINAYTSQVGTISVSANYSEFDFANIESNPVRCPDPEKAAEMEQLIREVKGDMRYKRGTGRSG